MSNSLKAAVAFADYIKKNGKEEDDSFCLEQTIEFVGTDETEYSCEIFFVDKDNDLLVLFVNMPFPESDEVLDFFKLVFDLKTGNTVEYDLEHNKDYTLKLYGNNEADQLLKKMFIQLTMNATSDVN